MAVQAIRSLIFYLLFLGQTVILALVVGTMALFARGWFPAGWAIGKYWAASNLFFLRWVTSIRTEVEGVENIPEQGCIIAAKHQSDWDIFTILPHAGRPAFIAKKELMDIPFFGRAARSLETISIDRSKGSGAVPAMLDDARAAIGRGCKIIIFPEGTRRSPLADPAYRYGTARLYEGLNVPVVPVALNSGLFWGRNSLVLWPGTAKLKFLPPIPAGLDAKTFHERLISEVETATEDLVCDSAETGLTRPLSPDFRERLEAAKARRAQRQNPV